MSRSSSSNRPRQRTVVVAGALLVLMTMIGVTASTTSNVSVGEPLPAAGIVAPEEKSYYEYVSPRLDRLVQEVDSVVKLVDAKSRDLISLTLSGERIEALTNEIIAYAEEHGVPERFHGVHDEIVSGTDLMTDSFGEAKTALRRFKFSRMTALIDQFNAAAARLHDAQEHLQTLAGVAAFNQLERQGPNQ